MLVGAWYVDVTMFGISYASHRLGSFLINSNAHRGDNHT